MEVLNKVRIPTAMSGSRPMPKNGTHITTQDFMQLRPFGYHHPIPGTSGTVKGIAKTNLMPIGQPLYGKARQNLRAFWVPYRLVCPDFDNFITDTPSYYNSNASIPQEAPILSSQLLDDFFEYVDPAHVSSMSEPATQQQVADGIWDWTDAQGNHFVYTATARHYLVIVESLGYKVLHIPSGKVDAVPYNGLALLSYLKIWLDWYANGQYLDSSFVKDAEQLLLRTRAGYSMTATDLTICLTAATLVGYDANSYFISAWDSPVAPNANNLSTYTIPDVTTINPAATNPAGYTTEVANSGVSANPYGTPFLMASNASGTFGVGYSPQQISQFNLDSLKALTDFLKRNQLSGRAIDRYLARYGVQLRGESIKRSVYLGFKSIDIQFGQVVQTADTNVGGQSNLGDKAGIGQSDGAYSFDYDTNGEHGVVILVSSILPDGDIVTGYDRNNRHITRTSFFQPEFDQLGTQAIEKGEACTLNNAAAVTGKGYQGVFGFAPTYAEYKVGRSFFTGDLSIKSVMQGGRAWCLYRFLDDIWNTTDAIQHSLAFTLGTDFKKYDRIFSSTDWQYDHFICFFSCDWDESSPAKSLFDSFDFKQNGRSVTLDSNGVKVN